MTDAPTWTILVPTLGQRAPLFERLMRVLLPQIEPYEGRVRVVAWWNNGQPALPEIRHQMIQDTQTDYVSFVDDDDLVPEYFVAEVVAALEQRPDYVGWLTHYTSNGADHGLVYHSLEHKGWFEEKNPYRLLRDITHINPMRTDVAKRGDFRRGARPGRPEDRPWVDQIRRTGLLKTEVYIDKIMYEYLWRSDTSAWRKPHKIDRRPMVRPGFTSPYFSWHPGSTGSVAPVLTNWRALPASIAQGATLSEMLMIIPTRGRPQNMRRVIDAWKATGAFEVASLLFCVDNDDEALINYFEVATHEELDLGVIVTKADRLPMARRTNAEAVLWAGSYFALGSAGDDHVPETDGWAQRYLAELKALRAGIVYGDDGFQGAKLCTEWAMTSNIVQALGGRLVPAPVDHLYADNSVMELGKAAACIKHLPDIKIRHVHPVAGFAQAQDEGYQRVNSSERYRQDGATFQEWRKRQLPADASLIRSLGGQRVAIHSGRPLARHRTNLGLARGGEILSRPSTRLDTAGQRGRPVMTIPRRIKAVRGLTSEDAMLALADMAIQVPAEHAIVELGVYMGKTALVLAWGASQGAGAHVYAVDPWELADEASEHPADPMYRKWPAFNSTGARRWAEYNVQALGYRPRISLIHGFSAEVGRSWQGVPVGLLFVDGDHRYDAVRADVAAWAPHLAVDARIVIDDYESSHPDVIRAVDDLVAEGVLEPFQLFHGRMAVTKLANSQDGAAGRTLPTREDGSVGDPVVVPQVTGTVDLGAEVVHLPESDAEPEEQEPAGQLAPHEPERFVVQAEELEGVAAGTSIEDLTLEQMKALARRRKITLGARKDKKSETLQALKDGA